MRPLYLRRVQDRLIHGLPRRAYPRKVQSSDSRTSDANQQLLAIIEAELGSLLDFVPVPLLVTSSTGEILRANRAALLFLDLGESVLHKRVKDVVSSQAIDMLVTVLRHEHTVVRLCALQHHNC
jgi:PAS domain-containing protein